MGDQHVDVALRSAGPAATEFVGLTDHGGDRLGHLPGLDGLRGLAVAVVVAFHAGFERMVGGYLGVSTFFTLSGFLITSLLLNEARRSGGVGLRRFWGRRLRRLLPASLVTLAGVVVLFGPFVATVDQRLTLRGDVLSSLFDVANWHDILTGGSYARQLFQSPSPVLHFWSLSIEEQFYLGFPLVIVGLWAVTRGRRGLLAVGLGSLALASFLEPFVIPMSDDRIYFGTDTRAAELLLGALLAVALSSRLVRRRLALRRTWRTGAIVAGSVALAVQAWWWWQLPQSTWWLYRGGFALYALLSCSVITAVALPSGPLRAMTSLPALRWLGGCSYGIYLIHWPIFLTVRQTWPDLGRWPSTVVAVGVTLGLAVLSRRFIEQPVLARRRPARMPAMRAGVLGVAVVAAVALFPLPVDRSRLTPDFVAVRQDLSSRVADRSATSTPAPPPTPAPPTPAPPGPTSIPGTPPPATTPPAPPARIAVVGDSTALGVGMGVDEWLVRTGRPGVVAADARVGCGVSRFAARKVDTVSEPGPGCDGWPRRWTSLVAAHHPDVVLLLATFWEVPDVRLPGSSRWSAIGDPRVDAFIERELLAAVDVLSSHGSLVVLVTWPDFGTWADDGRSDAVARQTDPARIARYRQIQRRVAAQRPDTVRVIDLAGWMGDRSQDRSLRADGTHFLSPQFERLTAEWFGPALETTWTDWWRSRPVPAGVGRVADPAPVRGAGTRPSG